MTHSVHFYYDNQWRTLETRNGSNQTTRQWAYGTQYVDEVLFMDVNGDPTTGTDCNPDTTLDSDNATDHRYFYQQDRNWNVVALTDYEPGGGGDNGAIVERYVYTSYGEPTILGGVGTGTAELANAQSTSSVGNTLIRQGLTYDTEIGTYLVRLRQASPSLGRFTERDPLFINVIALDPTAITRNPDVGFSRPENSVNPGIIIDNGKECSVSAAPLAMNAVSLVRDLYRSRTIDLDGAHLYIYQLQNPQTHTDPFGTITCGANEIKPAPGGGDQFSCPSSIDPTTSFFGRCLYRISPANCLGTYCQSCLNCCLSACADKYWPSGNAGCDAACNAGFAACGLLAKCCKFPAPVY